MASLKERIRTASDIKAEKVQVPEWGCEVWIKGLSAADREAYEAVTTKVDDKGKVSIIHKDMRAKLLVQCLHESKEDGAIGPRAFEDSAEDRAILSAKSGEVIERLVLVAQRLSGMSAREADQTEKN